jgi:hypothetical protein
MSSGVESYMPKQDIQHPDRAASTGAYFDGVILDGWLYTVGAFELITGQNADTTTKAHTARITWNRSWSAATVTDLSAGFDRVHSPIVPEPNTVGPWISFGAVLDPLGPVRTFSLCRPDTARQPAFRSARA